MEQEELNRILELHKKWLNGESGGIKADLSGADLRYVDLRDADLRYADLCGVDLRGVDLYGADLQYADLRGADLRDANLSGVDLRGAYLRDANLDFSVFPLWCGSFDIKDNGRLAKQLLGHIARLNLDNAPRDLQKFISKIPKKFSNDICKRHYINEV